jgi:hypothetical protein
LPEVFATLSRDTFIHLEVFNRENTAIKNCLNHLFPKGSVFDEFSAFGSVIQTSIETAMALRRFAVGPDPNVQDVP